MRRSRWSFCCILLLFAFLWNSAPLSASERILRFDAEAVVEEDASLVVTERIGIVAEGKEIRRGIIRTFPTDFIDTEGVRRRAGFELLSAKLNDSPTPFKVERVGGSVDIHLGPDTMLPHGEHLFTITYRTTGQLGFFREHDELYWNVTGNDWIFTIESASFRMRLPGREFGEGFASIELSTGKIGERRQDARVLDDGSVESLRSFPPGEGLTVVYTWPKGIVAPPAAPSPIVETWTPSPFRVLHLGMPFLLLVLMGVFWVLWGKDPPAQAVIPRFTPPKGVEAGFARYVQKMYMDDQAFAAMLLGIAVKGVLTIEEHSLAGEAARQTGSEAGGAMKLLSKLVGTSYRLRLNRESLEDTELSSDERLLVENLFGATRSELHLSPADRPVIQHAFRKLAARLKERGNHLLRTNGFKWGLGVAVFEVYAVATLVLMILFDQPRFEPIFALMAGPFLLLPFTVPMPSGKGSLTTKMLLRGVFPGVFFLVMLLVAITGASADMGIDPVSLPGPLLCVIILIIFKPLMRIRSVEGARLNEEIEGLRMFMGTAERHRLEMIHPPEDTPQLFESLLPYALALDTAATWANRFESVLASANYSPTWYRGNMRTFSTSSGLAAFSSGFSNAVASGTRSSGSGGRGSSGGGGGGGGGRGR